MRRSNNFPAPTQGAEREGEGQAEGAAPDAKEEQKLMTETDFLALAKSEPAKANALVATEVMEFGPEDWDPPCFSRHNTDDCEGKDPEFGWSGWCYTCGTMVKEVPGEPCDYIHQIASAWLVVEKMEADGFDWCISPDEVYFEKQQGAKGAYVSGSADPMTAGGVCPAITLAALKAKGVIE